jgi:hypothetical protein
VLLKCLKRNCDVYAKSLHLKILGTTLKKNSTNRLPFEILAYSWPQGWSPYSAWPGLTLSLCSSCPKALCISLGLVSTSDSSFPVLLTAGVVSRDFLWPTKWENMNHVLPHGQKHKELTEVSPCLSSLCHRTRLYKKLNLWSSWLPEHRAPALCHGHLGYTRVQVFVELLAAWLGPS